MSEVDNEDQSEKRCYADNSSHFQILRKRSKRILTAVRMWYKYVARVIVWIIFEHFRQGKGSRV
jgi:hypothetical protein